MKRGQILGNIDSQFSLRHDREPVALQGHLSQAMREHRGELVERCLSLTARVSGVTDVVGGRSVFIKGGPLPSSAARRHRLRGALLGLPLPASREFHAAQWLRKRLFQCPEPLAAIEARSAAGIGASSVWDRRLGGGRLASVRRPVAQLFMTAAVPGAATFDRAWTDLSEPQRERVCQELGTEVGRMHALHYLHADLYPRNVLVDQTGAKGRWLWFIDSWAGGATAWRSGSLRRVESDLGTWLSEFKPDLGGAYLRTLLEAYVEARAQNGRPLENLGRWLEAVQRARRSELRRLERQRYRLRGAPFPQAGFALPMPSPAAPLGVRSSSPGC